MATTRIIPLHAGKGRTVGKAISDITLFPKADKSGYSTIWRKNRPISFSSK